LREQHVYREADPEVAVELDDPVADRGGMRAALRAALGQKIGDGDRDENAVDRPALAILLQKTQEAEPRGAVGFRVAVLRRVASGRVDQHGVVGEPPVAVARAADAADRIRTEALAQREAQAR